MRWAGPSQQQTMRGRGSPRARSFERLRRVARSGRMLSSGGRRHDPARKRANWSQRRKRVRLAVEETPHDPGNVLRAHDVSEVMDSSLLSRRAGAAVAAMCPAMIGTAPGCSTAPVRAVMPWTPTALTAYNWRARVMCAGWIGSGVIVRLARAYDAGLRAWSISIGRHRASRRETDQRPREARFLPTSPRPRLRPMGLWPPCSACWRPEKAPATRLWIMLDISCTGADVGADTSASAMSVSIFNARRKTVSSLSDCDRLTSDAPKCDLGLYLVR
jgi:hypothetical protein